MIILDNGHGVNTPGKRSPEWGDIPQLFEWEFNRDIVRRIADKLDVLGIEYKVLVPEDEDISLGERVRRANAIYTQDKSSYLISVHANAGGGTGWEVFTGVGETKSDKIAEVFCEQAEKFFPGFRMRFDTADGDKDKESNFYILKNTNCPAILTENFFMDTRRDCEYILSEEGRENIADMHVAGIQNYITA